MKTEVEIPGRLVARVENGRVRGYTFVAYGNDPGYFGDDIRILDGEWIGTNEFFGLVSNTLTISEDSKSAFFTVEWAS